MAAAALVEPLKTTAHKKKNTIKKCDRGQRERKEMSAQKRRYHNSLFKCEVHQELQNGLTKDRSKEKHGEEGA